MCHLDDTNVEDVYPALLAALATLEPTTKIFYHNVTVGRLPAAARARWEAFLVTTTVGKRYYDEMFNEIDARAEARGEALGEARSVLLVLESRGVPVPDAIRERILASVDTAQLDRWLRRAATATAVEDVIQD
jgi:biotin carboxylase